MYINISPILSLWSTALYAFTFFPQRNFLYLLVIIVIEMKNPYRIHIQTGKCNCRVLPDYVMLTTSAQHNTIWLPFREIVFSFCCCYGLVIFSFQFSTNITSSNIKILLVEKKRKDCIIMRKEFSTSVSLKRTSVFLLNYLNVFHIHTYL